MPTSLHQEASHLTACKSCWGSSWPQGLLKHCKTDPGCAQHYVPALLSIPCNVKQSKLQSWSASQCPSWCTAATAPINFLTSFTMGVELYQLNTSTHSSNTSSLPCTTTIFLLFILILCPYVRTIGGSVHLATDWSEKWKINKPIANGVDIALLLMQLWSPTDTLLNTRMVRFLRFLQLWIWLNP